MPSLTARRTCGCSYAGSAAPSITGVSGQPPPIFTRAGRHPQGHRRLLCDGESVGWPVTVTFVGRRCLAALGNTGTLIVTPAVVRGQIARGDPDQRMTKRPANVLYSADPDGVSAQIDLIGVPWLMIGKDPVIRAERRLRARPAGCLAPHIGPRMLHRVA
jgi:hypothetical protein